jgi:hypothetical protein
MKRTQIQFPDPLYQRIKEVAVLNDWALADVVRRAVELYVDRFPDASEAAKSWSFPTLDLGGDFLVDPKDVHSEAEAIGTRGRSQ